MTRTVHVSPTPQSVIDAHQLQTGGGAVPVAREPVDLNAVRSVVQNEQRGGPASVGVYVDEQGNLALLGNGGASRMPERLTRVTDETFYAPDLNKIAETIRANQQAGDVNPDRLSRQLVVDSQGGLHQGGDVDQDDRRLTRVTQETFYSAARLREEQEIVRVKMPATTTYASDGQYEGWLYAVVTEFGDRFELFLWFEPSSRKYKVSLVEPRLGGAVGVHDCHLFADGTLCLKRSGGGGYRQMEKAYARSVLWTRGASCYMRGYGFQFNIDQD